MEIAFVFPNTRAKDQFIISEDLIVKCVELEQAYDKEHHGARPDPLPKGMMAACRMGVAFPAVRLMFAPLLRVVSGTEQPALSLELAKLPKLSLSYVGVPRIENLHGLYGLRELRLDNNKITRITGLEALVNLQWLDLSFNRIEVIEGLETLTKITDLSLFSNAITELKGLDGQKNMQVSPVDLAH
jgi:Leucine-rich repeat (LRR) protein